MLSIGLKMELSSVREENASLAVSVSEYKVRVKILENKVDKEELSGMALLRELKQSKRKVKGLVCKNKLPPHTTERDLDSAVS